MLDVSRLTAGDIAVALRSFARRFAELAEGAVDEDLGVDLLHGGEPSAADIIQEAAGALAEIGSTVTRLTGLGPRPEGAQDRPGAAGSLAAAATSLADQVDRVQTDGLVTKGYRAGTELSLIDILRHGVRETAESLDRAGDAVVRARTDHG